MKNHQIDHKSYSQTIDVTAPWQAPIDHKAMQCVEQRVIKQLLQALLYENIIEFDYENAASSDDDTLLDFTIKTANHIHYQAQGYIHYSFDIIRFNDHNVQCVIDGKSHDATLENVINDILLKIEAATLKDSFIKELRHTLINETQAQRQSPHLSVPNMPAAIDRLTYEQLEGYLMAGHPYHPCFKSRIGFDLQDNYDYGPEFAQNIEVVWLAVKKDLLVSNTAANIDVDEWIKDYVDMDKFAALHDKLNH
ncbi:MAG: short-chain oxidoreductase, partial [Psychrobacter sp.]|nr:short-chain oxidoreductase [Psychrobacter sp.]